MVPDDKLCLAAQISTHLCIVNQTGRTPRATWSHAAVGGPSTGDRPLRTVYAGAGTSARRLWLQTYTCIATAMHAKCSAFIRSQHEGHVTKTSIKQGRLYVLPNLRLSAQIPLHVALQLWGEIPPQPPASSTRSLSAVIVSLPRRGVPVMPDMP